MLQCLIKKNLGTKQGLDGEGRAPGTTGTSFARLGPAPAGGEWTGRTRWGTAPPPPPPPPQRLGLACLLSKTRPLLFVCTAGRAAVPQRDRRHGHLMMSRAGCTVPCWLLLGHLAFLFAFPEWSGTANNPCPSASTFFFPPFWRLPFSRCAVQPCGLLPGGRRAHIPLVSGRLPSTSTTTLLAAKESHHGAGASPICPCHERA